MATNLKKFESLGGFYVDETIYIDEEHNAMSLNSIEMKNQFYSDSKTTNYILRGVNTATLQLDNVGTQITIENNTVNLLLDISLELIHQELYILEKLKVQFIVMDLEQHQFSLVC